MNQPQIISCEKCDTQSESCTLALTDHFKDIRTVEQQTFVCRKFSRISQILGDLRNFPAREYYHNTVGDFSYLKIRENYLHANCLWPKFAKFSCCEIFLFYFLGLYLRQQRNNLDYGPDIHHCTVMIWPWPPSSQ